MAIQSPSGRDPKRVAQFAVESAVNSDGGIEDSTFLAILVNAEEEGVSDFWINALRRKIGVPLVCEACGETLVSEDCPNYGSGPEHA